ncbi:MAG: hypothetical protein LAO07_10660 [Acidobacteriia bacterium]|nr:hypothetical protein [Terriglobia bacterium]
MNLKELIGHFFPSPTIRGKVFVTHEFEPSTDELGSSFLRPQLSRRATQEFLNVFPMAMRADTLEDADVVIELTERRERVGHYTGVGWSAIRSVCHVRVLGYNRVIAEKVFQGPAPPPQVYTLAGGRPRMQEVSGGFPTEAICAYLRGLVGDVPESSRSS